MSLDKRLDKELAPLAKGWESWAHDQLDGTSYIKGELENIEQIKKNTVEAIKQAFIDEYWIDTKTMHTHVGGGTRIMTGPEWLARFEKYRPTPRQQAAIDFNKEVTEAARRAAGVDE